MEAMNETCETTTRKKKYLKVVVFAFLVAAIIAVSHIPQVRNTIGFARIQELSASVSETAARPWGPPLFVLISAAVLLLHMPEIVVIVLGGMVYDFWTAFFLTWAGCGLGTTCTFLVSRFFLRDYFKPKLEGSFLKRFDERFVKDGIVTMCMLRLILFLSPPLNWLIGATGIKTRDYIIGNFLGIAPWLLGVLTAVRKLEQVNSLSDLLQFESIALLAGFTGVFLVIVYIRKKYYFKGV
jgi:phospholipase D1/2